MALPLAAGGQTAVFLELGGLLLVLAALAWIGTVTDLSTIPLYLVGGLVAGIIDPFPLSEDFIELGAQIGIVLLLFMLGLEYSAEEITENLRLNLPAGVIDFVLGFSIGLVAGLVLGWSFTAAFLLGGATYISSSGVIAKVLEELGRLGNRETPTVLSLLVIEDLAMAAYLPIASVLLVGGAFSEAFRSLAIALAAAGLVFVLALRYGSRISRVLDDVSDEVLLLGLLGVVLAVAGGAEAAQVSAGVGAFLVGIAVSGTLAERARIQITPVRDLFAATFFVFFGLSIEADRLPEVLVPAAIIAAISALTKYGTARWAARKNGAGPAGAARAGTVFIAHGEFSIVIAGLGATAGIEPELGPLVAAFVLITAIGGAVVTRFAGRPRTAPATARAPGVSG